MSFARFTVFGFLASIALLAGCSTDDGPELGTVTGRVTMNGKPLPNMRVVFSLGHSRPSAGITDSDGRYELKYTVARQGALLGQHKVNFYRTDETDEAAGASIPPTTSELVREVKPGANVFDFEL